MINNIKKLQSVFKPTLFNCDIEVELSCVQLNKGSDQGCSTRKYTQYHCALKKNTPETRNHTPYGVHDKIM